MEIEVTAVFQFLPPYRKNRYFQKFRKTKKMNKTKLQYRLSNVKTIFLATGSLSIGVV